MLNDWEAMQQELVNLYQFFLHVDYKLISTLKNDKSVFCVLMIPNFVNFPVIPRICNAKLIHWINGNFWILKISYFTFSKS